MSDHENANVRLGPQGVLCINGMTGSSAGIRSKIGFRQSVVRRNAGTDEKCGEFPFLGKRRWLVRHVVEKSGAISIYADQVGSDHLIRQ